eukprot:CAMPEP_0116050930 /NCGR_PEP_ID=MMETSP0322-20121206/676_1 /TAXON_ID=163516 /ORGANISM="Leptocylindrus danicus var. apora, Strain B651" /LENGTH=637 /DNA_ID=CAMNT_0003533579 /DNA_START=25 /DNA_END=1935 /DNA_ORIENTATION=+
MFEVKEGEEENLDVDDYMTSKTGLETERASDESNGGSSYKKPKPSPLFGCLGRCFMPARLQSRESNNSIQLNRSASLESKSVVHMAFVEKELKKRDLIFTYLISARWADVLEICSAQKEKIRFNIQTNRRSEMASAHATHLHLACSLQAPTPVLLALLESYPHAATIEDKTGKLPIHRLMLASNIPRKEIFKELVKLYPESIDVPDNTEATPRKLANQAGGEEYRSLIEETLLEIKEAEEGKNEMISEEKDMMICAKVIEDGVEEDVSELEYPIEIEMLPNYNPELEVEVNLADKTDECSFASAADSEVLAFEYYAKGDVERAQHLMNDVVAIVEGHNNILKVTTVLNDAGNMSFGVGDYTKATSYYKLALTKNVPKSEKVGLWYNLGLAYQKTKRLDEALVTINKALDVIREDNVQLGLANNPKIDLYLSSLRVKGNIYSAKEKYREALICFEEISDIRKVIGSNLEKDCSNELAIGKACLGLKSAQLAFEALNKALKSMDGEVKSKTLHSLGNLYIRNREYANAAHYYGRALSLKKENSQETTYSLVCTSYNLVFAYRKLGRYKDAIEVINFIYDLGEDGKESLFCLSKFKYAKLLIEHIKVLVALGDRKAAKDVYDRTLEHITDSGLKVSEDKE